MWFRKNKDLIPAIQALKLSNKNKLLINLEEQSRELKTLIKDIKDSVTLGQTSRSFIYLSDYQKELLRAAGYLVADDRKYYYTVYFTETGTPLAYPKHVNVMKKEDVPRGYFPEATGYFTVSWDNK